MGKSTIFMAIFKFANCNKLPEANPDIVNKLITFFFPPHPFILNGFVLNNPQKNRNSHAEKLTVLSYENITMNRGILSSSSQIQSILLLTNIYIYMYILYIYVWVYIYIYTHMFRLHIYIYDYVYTYVCVIINIYIYTYMMMYVYIYIWICVHIYIYIYIYIWL